jgi:hypothetical protein
MMKVDDVVLEKSVVDGDVFGDSVGAIDVTIFEGEMV